MAYILVRIRIVVLVLNLFIKQSTMVEHVCLHNQGYWAVIHFFLIT